ncbi:hypothetical protein SCA6_016612 [Theobroma cacao]
MVVMGFRQLVVFLLLSMAVLHGCMGNDDASIQLNDDVLGLIVFKSDIKDPSSYLDSWNEDDNSPCSWRFIKCNPVNGRVSEVSLNGLGLSGKIGKGLQKLQYLKVLSLSHNNFSSSISPELGLIGSLERLNLSHNSLSGRIPSSFVNMNSIRFLDLSGNSLSGSVPDDLFQTCSSLRYLSLAENSLEGQLPSTLARCFSLNTLDLSKNHFSGNIDFASGIYNMQRLRTLDLSHNEFSGTVPEGVFALHNLKELLLQDNRFSGPMPLDIGFCPHLNTLDLSYNLFTGPLPDSLQRLNFLSFFSLSNNMFTGDFPQGIANMSNLAYLDFSSNSLTGSLPSSIGNLKALNYLRLSNNRLTGNIPTSLGYCFQLSTIHLRDNGFNGSLPAGLFDLRLEEIDFSNNALTGSIPRGSSRLFESLQELDLSRNSLQGSIPAEMGLFANMRYLNLSWNNLQSRIPPELGLFQNLTVSLSHNNLSGSIPKTISNLSKLKILKLEFNELSGEIPQEIGLLQNLLAVNISYNQLTGRLPVGGIFPSLDQSALQGNLGICSPLLKGPCKMNVPKPLVLDPDAYNSQMGGHRQRNESSIPTKFHRHMFLSVSAIVAISAAILIVSGVIIISLLNVSARRRLAFVETALESMCSSSTRSGSLPTGKLILFDSKLSPDRIGNPEVLLNKAAEIGEGVFGTVYKVPLGAQGRIVAIKKLVTSNIIQYPDDFDREVRVLGKARHPNLISLEGYYWTPQSQLLVTEYAPNGNLQTKLHERIGSAPPLSWSNSDHVRVLLEQGNVLECVDVSMGDYPEDEVLPVLKLALVCTSQIPSSRPSMAEVVQILQVIKTPVPHRMEIF